MKIKLLSLFITSIAFCYFLTSCKKAMLVPVKTDTIPKVVGSIPKDTIPKDTIPKIVYTVINKGIGGNTADSLMKRLNDVFDNSPQLVIIMIGTNDFHKTPLARFKADLETMVSDLQDRGMKVLLMSPIPHGTTPIEIPEDDTNALLDAEVGVMNTVSIEKQCYYLDMNAAFRTQGTPNTTVTSLINNAATNPGQPDGIHPNHQGYVFMSEQIYAYMKNNGLMKYAKILCFGDSITHGQYPRLLGSLLNSKQ